MRIAANHVNQENNIMTIFRIPHNFAPFVA
ncbi:hypothetical protein X772_16790 [Mesorhizobium sp. LSJC280B00]|nr:hypothetical protein X772_16790 [Mesorhizobium sp. LSJC280B00]